MDTAARVEHRFLLRCEVVSPLSHSSGTASAVTDSPLRQTADGRVTIAGTAIAGALRTLLERLAEKPCWLYRGQRLKRLAASNPCSCDVCRLFGDVVPVDAPSTGPRPAHATASRVWIHDGLVEPPGETRIVDSVAIDGQRRSAEDAKKFDREELPAGTRILLDVRAQSLTDEEQRWLGTALRWLARGQIGLGGGTASGSGRLKCCEAAIYRRDLGEREQLLKAILHDGHRVPDVLGEPLPGWHEAVAKSLEGFFGEDDQYAKLQWTFVLRPREDLGGTFVVADPLAGSLSGWDRAPRGLTAGAFSAELPARSVRGALRSGAERILNTISPSAAQSLADALFGSVARASRLRVAVEADQPPMPSPWDHLAIDRFTGGASQGKKFDALAARGGSFRLSLMIVDAADSDLPWMKGLLVLTLRDLHQGRITIGHGSAKGHGYFELQAVDGVGPEEDRSWLHVLQADETVVGSWISALHKEIERQTVNPPVVPQSTSAPKPAARSFAAPAPSLPDKAAAADESRQVPLAQDSESDHSAAWTGRAARISTADLFSIAQQLGNAAVNAFLESPTRCAIRGWSQNEFTWSQELGNAWQFRLFGQQFELAARRLSFREPDQWAVRLVANDAFALPDAVQGHLQNSGVRLGSPTEHAVNLLGTARPDGQFSEKRFAAAGAALSYPGTWCEGAVANLQVRTFQLEERSLTCWVGLAEAARGTDSGT